MSEFSKNLSEILHYELFHVGNTVVTPYGIGGLILLFCLVVGSEKLFRKAVVRRLLERTPLAPSVRFGIEKISGYLFIAFGLYVSLQAIGLDLSSLAILAGALGVGLGFGLQNIFSNFISGIIILIEGPISIGDRVEVGGVAGQVAKISLRSTMVITNDNIAIIVPNSRFISESVTNWSHGDPKVRFRLPFGVAYGSDLELLKKVAIEVAHAHPHVLQEPSASLYFDAFGDSSLNFELGVWTSEMAHNPRKLRSELFFALEKKLRENGIEVPFPQRDLHIRSGATDLLRKPSE